MTLYFTWALPNEAFDPARHNRTDLNIFDLSIEEKEGDYPIAKLTIDPAQFPQFPEDETRKAFISWKSPADETHLLFQGYLLNYPVNLKKELVQMHLIGRPVDPIERLESLEFQHHPLFVKHPHKRLQSDFQLSSIYCCRRTLKISRSAFFQGQEAHTLDGSHFRDSVRTTLTSPPLSGVRIFLTVQWIQRARGLANIGEQIAQNFPDGQMASYSNLKMKRNALTPGQRLGRSGFWVVRSDIKRINTLEEEDHPPLHHYDWNFWVGWAYRQKRVETVDIHLPHRSGTTPTGETKDIHISLNNPSPEPQTHPWLPGVVYCPGTKVADESGVYICRQQHLSQLSRATDDVCWERIGDPVVEVPFEGPSLIRSEQGNQLIHYALDVARFHLAKSIRSFHVTFQGRWEDFHTVTTNMSLTLRDPRFVGGSIRGKVIAVKLRCCGASGSHWVDITLACAVGQEDEFSAERPDYTIEAEDEEIEGVHTVPTRLLQQIHVTNTPARQAQLLMNSSAEEHNRIVKRNPTRVQLQLTDLRSQAEIRQHYRVVVAEG